MLKPAVDYATSKNLYVIIDFHQIDNATTGHLGGRREHLLDRHRAAVRQLHATCFYEPFNEPIDTSVSWAALKPVAQG